MNGPNEGLHLYERLAGTTARALGRLLRRVMIAPRDGSTIDTGFRVAGFDMDRLRSR